MTFKDLFSERPDAYARYRPTYPAAAFAWLAAQTPGTRLAVDVGTGNGQAAVALAAHFARVLGLDPSEAQLTNARAHPRVEYRPSRAEQLAADDASADALFVAQALHWFQHDAFFAEAGRVLVPGGVLAVTCYELSVITPEIDAAVMELYQGYLDAYWEPERKMVETRYRTIDFPFPELSVPSFDLCAAWSFEDLVGYLGTWSPLKRFRSERGFDPLEAIVPKLRVAWGDAAEREVLWPFTVRAFRNG
ncbi:MAG: class I SAM-dependent methyltransferase [Deltaproteobacteria bacterium]|nr:MAG: class I SAM-dependent methyltransferase [Deltaproteobacteria bacterium]